MKITVTEDLEYLVGEDLTPLEIGESLEVDEQHGNNHVDVWSIQLDQDSEDEPVRAILSWTQFETTLDGERSEICKESQILETCTLTGPGEYDLD